MRVRHVAGFRSHASTPNGQRPSAGNPSTTGGEVPTSPRTEGKPDFPLDRYLEGWAKLNLEEIVDATAAGYCFRDPLVGTFSRWSLLEYFDVLMRACSRAGAIKRRDVGFELHGPMEGLSHLGGLWFWREAPGIGLTGVTQIKVGEHGVIGESVAYEGNLASDMLRRAAH
jgi:hypothetical protein